MWVESRPRRDKNRNEHVRDSLGVCDIADKLQATLPIPAEEKDRQLNVQIW